MGHYTGVDWKAPVATELLALHPTSFPLLLAMEQDERLWQEGWPLCDPRFLLP